MPSYRIPFNRPFIIGRELEYIRQAVESGHIAGDGVFTRKCNEFLENRLGARKVLLTTSCTAALEMAALLFGVGPGDEVIVPSFTFVSTANAFYLRGARLVFADILPDTLNIDPGAIERVLSPRTKVIVPVHYAGVGCDMDSIMGIADRGGAFVVEDAAQGVSSSYKGRYLGTIGHLGAFSFHETKNFICGEGGAIVINDERFIERAEIIREKGTDRSRFFRGEVDKYTWVDAGSSYLPSDILAAFLYAQLEHMEEINGRRKAVFDFYHQALAPLEKKGLLRLPVISEDCSCNNHMFYVLLNDEDTRDALMAHLKAKGVLAVFHYQPLHLSAVGRSMGYSEGMLPVTESASGRILRLPFYFGITRQEQEEVAGLVSGFLSGR